MTTWILVASFFLILIMISFINFKINKEFKIETSWLALSLTPVLIWLIATHQLSEFSGFGLAFKLNEVKASPVSLEFDGNAITPERISSGEKEGLGKIELFKQNRVQAITLEVGKQGYYLNRAIKRYLKELTPLSFFKYVLFVSETGEFKGIISGKMLLEEFSTANFDLVKLIESGDISSINSISSISAPSGSSKQKTLQIMDLNGLSELPVVDELNMFIGIVERNKITSSIVAQLVSSNGSNN